MNDDEKKTAKQVTMERFDLDAKLAEALVAGSDIIDQLPGGKTFLTTLALANDTYHRNGLETLSEDYSDEEYDALMEQLCGEGSECTTTKYLETITDFEECRKAARVAKQLKLMCEVVIKQMTWRAHGIDPQKLTRELAQVDAQAIGDMLAELFRQPPQVVTNPNIPVS